MRIPGFTAESSLTPAEGRYRARDVHRADREGGVVPQASRGYGAPVDLQDCWQRCIYTPWDCPTECRDVPWPTIPPPPVTLRAY